MALASAELVILVIWCYQDAGCCNLGTKAEQSGAGDTGCLMDTRLPEHRTPSTASLVGNGLLPGSATDPQTLTWGVRGPYTCVHI